MWRQAAARIHHAYSRAGVAARSGYDRASQYGQKAKFYTNEGIHKAGPYGMDIIVLGCTCYCIETYIFDMTMVGDVVIARSPQDIAKTVCKRVLALAGEHVVVQSQYWYQSARVVQIPPGHVWLEGDNPYNSTDSREYGPVPISLVKGIVRCKIYPPGAINKMERKSSIVFPPIRQLDGRQHTEKRDRAADSEEGEDEDDVKQHS